MTKRFFILFLFFLSYGGYLTHAAVPHRHEEPEHHDHGHGNHHHDGDDRGNDGSLAHFFASIAHIPGSADVVLGHASTERVLKVLDSPGVAVGCEILIAPVIEMDHHPPTHSKSNASNFSVTHTPLRAPPARS